MDSTPAPSAPPRRAATPFPLIVLLFVASGATGLVDQLCFSRYLTYIVGATAYAVSAVLAAFMTGLALGAHYAGRISSRVRRPLAAYGVVELVVALAVALYPLLSSLSTPLYVALARAAPGSLALLSVLRWLLAMALVILPTIAMGATLPLLSRYIGAGASARGDDATHRRERRLGALYAANTLGGAAGALGAAYFVIPALGLSGTLHASALTSAIIGVIALAFGRSGAPLEPLEAEGVVGRSGAAGGAPAPPGDEAPAHRRAAGAPAGDGEPGARELVLLSALAFASGWLVFAAEIVFTHLLALIIGNSAYAFGLILAVFLLCLFFGASLAPRAQARFGPAALPVGLALTGLALLAVLPLWDLMPALLADTGERVTSFAGREGLRAGVAFLVLLVPTTLMGLTFPLLLQRVARYRRLGELVGRLTAVNTIGAVMGSLLTGYLILPLLGSQRSLILVALAFAAAALPSLRGLSARARRAAQVLAGLAALTALAVPRWDLSRLNRGTNVYFDGGQSAGEVMMLREDVHGGVTAVMRHEGVDTLLTNGKFQGNTGWEMKAQRLFAHYPSLFVSDFDHALVIGLGTGTTLGTIEAYPWRRIDVAEISPSIAEAAARFFTIPNRDALQDPRARLHHADGRNFLLVSTDRYDLIGMELSSIWFAGASNLYSREYYRLVHQHLKSGGIFQQWVQLHHIYRRDFATILHTLRAEFDHVALFYGGGQGILVASDLPLRASAARLEALAARPAVKETLPDGRSLPGLLDDILVLDAGLDGFVARAAEEAGLPPSALVSTDDNLYLEYATPRGNVLPWSAREALVAELEGFRDPDAIDALLLP
ncbi:MAG: fused MFS/spermidine synthase [Sorangiineae bacterium]|nr:fused MFS/spermidine synthase [Polyangiaceae bacterium]MEB2322787.1 fused MFS/spermidine synthase [Sorangiineae bacterium]